MDGLGAFQGVISVHFGQLFVLSVRLDTILYLFVSIADYLY